MSTGIAKTFRDAWKKITAHMQFITHEETIPEFQQKEPSDTNNRRTISANAAWTFWGVGALVVLLSRGFWKTATMISLIVTGWIVSLAIERLIQLRQRFGASRGFSMTIAYLLLFLFMISGIIIMIPFIVSQLSDLFQIGVDAFQQFQGLVKSQGLTSVIEQSHLPSLIKSFLASQASDGGRVALLQGTVSDHMSQVLSVGGDGLKSAGSVAVGVLNGTFNTLFNIGLVMTIAVFFSMERVAVLTFVAELTNQPKKTYQTLISMSTKLGLWLEGQLLLCIIIGFCSAIGLRLLEIIGFSIPNKFSLALIAGLTEFVPYIGPILGSIPALLVGTIAYGWKGFLAVGVIYRAIQFLENNIIVPAIIAQKLGINPLVIFLAMLLGATLFGFLGILLAVPLAVIVTIWSGKN